MPKLAKTSAGSFPEWERRVRDLVMCLFKVDAAQQFVRNRDNASDKRAHAALLHALHGAFADKPFRASDVLAVYDDLAQRKRLQGALTRMDLAQRATEADKAALAAQAVRQAAETARGAEAVRQVDKALEAAQQKAGVAQKALQTATRHNAGVALFEALEEQFGDKPVNTRRFGWWVRSVHNAHIAGLRLTRTLDGDGHAEISISPTAASLLTPRE
jgi:hypothetical protein